MACFTLLHATLFLAELRFGYIVFVSPSLVKHGLLLVNSGEEDQEDMGKFLLTGSEGWRIVGFLWLCRKDFEARWH